MKSRQEISDEEIHSYMNFDKLLHEKQIADARNKNLRRFWNISIGIGVLTISIMLVYYNLDFSTAKPSHLVDASETSDQQAQVPAIENPDQVSLEGNLKIQEKKEPQLPISNTEKKSPSISDDDKKVVEKQQKTNTEIVYIQAEPVNGYPDLYTYFDKKLVYPQEARKDSAQGVVTVVFTIDADGKPQQIQIEKSLGKVFDKEVYRLITNMPLWKPASYNGKHVNSKVSLPLTFEMKKLNPKN